MFTSILMHPLRMPMPLFLSLSQSPSLHHWARPLHAQHGDAAAPYIKCSAHVLRIPVPPEASVPDIVALCGVRLSIWTMQGD